MFRNESHRTTAISIFSIVCAVGILSSILREPGAPAKEWRKATGTQQIWNMFHSIPTHHRAKFYISAKDKNGKEHRYGVLLPELTDADPSEDIRYYYAYERLFFSQGPILRGYIGKIDRALKAKNPDLVSFQIVGDFEYTKKLSSIKRDNKVAISKPRILGPILITK